MKSLRTLIKLRKDEVDKRRKEIAEIEARQQKLRDEHAKIGGQIIIETEAAREFPETAVTFASFLKKSLKRQEDLMRTIKQLQQVIDKKRDELLVAFGELKKLEIVLERKIEEQYQAELKREQIMLDEIAGRKPVHH